MRKAKTPESSTGTWRDHPDRAYPGYPHLPSAESLHPGVQIMHRYVCGDPVAIGIIAAWEPSHIYADLIRVVPR